MARKIHVFIASPSDLPGERRAFRDAIDVLNAGFGDGADIEFVPLGWEDTLATTGRRPQSVINDEIDACDVFVLAFYRRWGQDAPDADPYDSYTEEEFHRALDRFTRTQSPRILVFFKHLEPEAHTHPDPQLTKVLQFRRQLEESHRVLYRAFSDDVVFKREVDIHLRAFAKGDLPEPGGDRDHLVLPIEYVKRVEDAEATAKQALVEARRQRNHAAIADAKKAYLALRVAVRAAQAALAGRLEDARQDFALALEGTAHPATIFLAFDFYYRTGNLAAAEKAVARLLSTPIQEGHLAAMALNSLGSIYLERGQLDRAEQMYTSSLKLSERMGDSSGVAATSCNLGRLFVLRGKLDKAEAFQQAGLTLSESLGDHHGLVTQYTSLGATFKAKGALSKAQVAWRKGLAIAETLAIEESIANLLSNLADIESLLGNDDVSETMHCKALSIFEKLGHVRHIAIQFSALGIIHKDRREFSRAEELHRKALSLNEASGYAEGVAQALGNLGMVFIETGNLEKAEALCRRALTLDEKLGAPRGIAAQTGNLAMIYLARGDLEHAELTQRRAVEMFERVGDINGIGRNYNNLGVICEKRGELDNALDAYGRSLVAFEAMGDRTKAARQRANVGIIYLSQDKFDQAKDTLLGSLEEFQSLGRIDQASGSLAGLASLYERIGELEKAEEALLKMPAGNLEHVVAALARLAEAHRARDEDAKSVELHRRLLRLAEASGPLQSSVVTEVAVWAHTSLADHLLREVNTSSIVDPGRFAEIFDHYSKALTLATSSGDRHSILCAWAATLVRQADYLSGDLVDGILAEACDKYDSACKLDAHEHDWFALGGWGNVLAARARLKEDLIADAFYAEATSKFEAALRMKPASLDLLHDFGRLLTEHGSATPPERADAMFARASVAFEEILRLAPNDEEAGISCAFALMQRAGYVSGERAESLMVDGVAKYMAVLTVNPSNHDALHGLATIRLWQANCTSEDIRRPLLEEAKARLLQAQVLIAEMGSNDAEWASWLKIRLACAHAALGEESSAREVLQQLVTVSELPSREELVSEPSVAVLLSQPWFSEFIS